MVTLLLADERVNPNIANNYGDTALMFAAHRGQIPMMTLLLADERVNPNMTNQKGFTALMGCGTGIQPGMDGSVNRPVITQLMELLLADHRTIRIRPVHDIPARCYDAALFNVKYARHARFRGLVRAVVAFRRMRLRAAEAVYAPGGAGFAAAAASFEAGQAALEN